jgi:type I restriction enzyme S subunit
MKSENLNLITIADLVKEGAIVEIQDGNHGEKHPKTSDYVDDGVPFIMANNIAGNRVDIDGAQKIPLVLADSLRIGFAKTGDVLLTHKGTIGSTAIVDTTLPYLMLTPQVTYYRTNPEKLRNRYLMYAFREELFQKTIISLAQQATRPYIGITAQRRLKIRWKPIDQQDRVVEILSAYDDLIENNRRRIQLLEQSARLLYKEWFVHLRFPGHEHTQIIDGVPDGWEKTTIRESAAFISRGITPKYDDDAPGIVINQKCIRNRMVDLDFARRQSKQVPPQKLVQFGDVLINSTGAGTLGRVAQFLFETDECTVDSHVTIVRPKEGVPVYYFGLHLTDLESYVATLGRGATNQTELSRNDIATLKIVLPSSSSSQIFESIVEPTFHQIRILSEQVEKLIKARDLLLPKLMNGEVEV